jgi:hypothetical protein
MTLDGLTMLSGVYVRVPLPANEHQLVYVHLVSAVPIPYVAINYACWGY